MPLGSWAEVRCRWSQSLTGMGSRSTASSGPPVPPGSRRVGPGSRSRQVRYPPSAAMPVPGEPLRPGGPGEPLRPGGPGEPLRPGEQPGAGSPDRGGVAGPGGAPDGWPSGAPSRVGGLVSRGWLPCGRLPGAGGLVRGGSGFRLPGLAQPWARGWPPGPVTVIHHFVAGCPAAWVARSRARAASMGPNPVASPGWSARPSRVARGMVRLIFAAGRIGAGGGPSGPVPLGCSGAALPAGVLSPAGAPDSLPGPSPSRAPGL